MKYLPSSTMVYSCTCAWLQNPEAPLVCAPAGLRRPYAHTSDTPAHIMRCYLSNSQSTTTVTDYLATAGRVNTIDNVEPVFGGLWARNVSID